MMNETADGRVSIARLIIVPAIISVVVTLLRLAGELQHWSPRWFSSATGGIEPHGVSWIIGITWLPVFFGIYFALCLARSGRAPSSAGRAVVFAFAGLAVLVAGFFFVVPALHFTALKPFLITLWLTSAIAGGLQFFGWRALAKTLLAYGLVSRAVVAIIMSLAMRGHWGTHYDYALDPDVKQLGFATEFWWLAFFPQLVFWVGFTIMLGSLSGTIAHAVTRRSRARQQPATAVS
jgi:hypothetical protein